MKTERSGYTLIEILIATLLMATLMSAIYGLFGLYASFLEAGRSQVQRQQLVRSVTQLLETDLRQLSNFSGGTRDSASFPSEAGFSGGLTDDATAAEPQMAATDFGPENVDDESGVAQLPILGLSGTADVIRLVLHAPTRLDQDTSHTATAGGFRPSAVDTQGAQFSSMPLGGSGQAPIVHQLQQVVYHFEPPGLVSGGSLPLDAGLYRVATSWLEFEQLQAASAGLSADAFGQQSVRSVVGVSELPEFEQLVDRVHVPEVVRCRFSYFDGSLWRTSWSSQQDGLPMIVKLEFEVVSATDAKELQQLFGDGRVEATDVVQPMESAGETAELDPLQQIRRTRFEHLILLRPAPGIPQGFREGSATGSTLASDGGEL